MLIRGVDFTKEILVPEVLEDFGPSLFHTCVLKKYNLIGKYFGQFC